MTVLAIAAILATGACAPLDLRTTTRFDAPAAQVEAAFGPRSSAPARGPVWLGLAAQGFDTGLGQGDGGYLIQADLGYEAKQVLLAASLRYQAAGLPGWPDPASVMVSASRTLGRHGQLDLQLSRGLNGAGGGFGGGLTIRRWFGAD